MNKSLARILTELSELWGFIVVLGRADTSISISPLTRYPAMELAHGTSLTVLTSFKLSSSYIPGLECHYLGMECYDYGLSTTYMWPGVPLCWLGALYMEIVSQRPWKIGSRDGKAMLVRARPLVLT